ncbi:teichuronic acid exporter [Pseudoalteromonas sp. MBR-15]|jgi:O-antigen/teichoic acid export membrane protein
MSRGLQHSLILNSIWSFVGRFGYLIVGLITNIILVRYLSPEDFGLVGIVMFFIVLSSILMESGLSGALVRKQNATEIDYSTVLIFSLVVSIFLILIICLSASYISNYYLKPELQSLLIVSSFVLLINSLRIPQTVKLMKNMQFKKKALYEFISISAASVLAVIMASYGAGVWSLVVLQVAMSLILTVLLWVVESPLKQFRFSMRSFREFYKFGVNTTLATILNTAFDNVYQLIIGKYFSVEHAGYFYQAKKLQEMPTGLLQNAALGVVYSALSKLQGSYEEFNSLYGKVVRVFTILLSLLCLNIYFYSELIVTVIYGDEWYESIFYLKMLILVAFFFLQEIYNRIIFKVFNRTEIILKLEVFKKVLQSIGIFYGVYTLSIDNLLYAFLFTSVISFFINYYFARKVQMYFSFSEFLFIIKIVILSMIVYVATYYLSDFFFLEGVKLLLLFPVIIFLYLIGYFLMGCGNLVNEVGAFLKSIKKGEV